MLVDVSMHRIRRRFFIFSKKALVVLRKTIISIVLVIIQRFYVSQARTRDRYFIDILRKHLAIVHWFGHRGI